MAIWQKIKMVALAGAAALMLAAVPMAQTQAITCEKGSLREGAEVDNVVDCNVLEAEEGNDMTSLVNTAVAILLGLIGIVTVAVVIYGATQMVLSQGDPAKVKTGRTAIIAGVTGLIIALLAWAIINVVTHAISN